MTKNIYGGGNQTNKNGLKFEQDTDLLTALSAIEGYHIDKKESHNNAYDIFFNGQAVGISFPKHALYKAFLKDKVKSYNFKEYISKQLLPDEAIFVYQTNKVYIIEKKFQNVPGSVDEKLQTCDFKKKQYIKLFNPLDIGVEYIYVLNDWFKKEEYEDVRDYINSSGCYYYYNEIPLALLGLPTNF